MSLALSFFQKKGGEREKSNRFSREERKREREGEKWPFLKREGRKAITGRFESKSNVLIVEDDGSLVFNVNFCREEGRKIAGSIPKYRVWQSK